MLDKEKIDSEIENTKEKILKTAKIIGNKLNSNEKIKSVLDAIFAKVAPKWIAAGLGALLVLGIGAKAISGNGKLEADYYVYQTQTSIIEGKGYANRGMLSYSDIVNILVFFKYKNEDTVEIFTFRKMNTSKNDSPFTSLLGWQRAGLITSKYKLKNGNEIYTYNKDGTLDESNCWEIEGNTILAKGYEFVGMSEHDIRHNLKINGNLLKQNYSKKVKAGKMKSYSQQYTEESNANNAE